MNDRHSSPCIRDLGEQELLKQLQQFCPTEWVGDDAAAIAVNPPPGSALVVTTDMLVDGVHFSDRTTSPEDVGWRAAAANLSDLAAMGASAFAITVSLGLRGDTALQWVQELYQGMVSCLQQYQSAIAGGDICRSPVNSISIAALGWVEENRTIRRSLAQPGDAIVVTGFHGASRAGLELLLHPETGENLSEGDRQGLVKAHQRPQPRFDVLPILWELVPEGRAIAGMDSSDGLADAVLQIARASGVGATLERDRLPIPPAVKAMVSEQKAIEWTLYGGEDFELVLCLPRSIAETLVQRLGKGAAIVGAIVKNTSVCLIDSTGACKDEVLTLSRGFQHF